MPLSPTDFFQTPSLDLVDKGGVDVLSFYNDLLVPLNNKLEVPALTQVEDVTQEIENEIERNQAQETIVERASSTQELGDEIGLFDEQPLDEGQIDNGPAFNQPSRSPSEPLTIGDKFSVFEGSRDQIKGFSSKAGSRKISLDFNDAENKSARGVEIVVPKDATPEEIEIAAEWASRTHKFLNDNGVKVPLRRGNGVKKGGGKRGVFHTEPFFVANSAAQKLIASKGAEYAEILGGTLGRLPGSTFIAPHERNAQGAQGGGFSERSFAMTKILPHLKNLSAGGTTRPSGGKQSTKGADFAFMKELRTDSRGRLTIYSPPSSDANSKEVAGFGNVTDGPQFKELSKLIRAGKHDEATNRAKQLLTSGAEDIVGSIKDSDVSSVVTGLVHHRGKNGTKSILSFAGVKNANELAGISKDRWLRARAKQERQNEVSVWKRKKQGLTLEAFRAKRRRELGGSIRVGNLGSFPKGLYNRWVDEANTLS